jgi:hypothetical protein
MPYRMRFSMTASPFDSLLKKSVCCRIMSVINTVCSTNKGSFWCQSGSFHLMITRGFLKQRRLSDEEPDCGKRRISGGEQDPSLSTKAVVEVKVKASYTRTGSKL